MELSKYITDLDLTGEPEAVIREIRAAVEKAATKGTFKRLRIEVQSSYDDDYSACLRGIYDEPPELIAEKNAEIERRDRETLARLLAKYPIPSASWANYHNEPPSARMMAEPTPDNT
jgi:hypothetical protein